MDVGDLSAPGDLARERGTGQDHVPPRQVCREEFGRVSRGEWAILEGRNHLFQVG